MSSVWGRRMSEVTVGGTMGSGKLGTGDELVIAVFWGRSVVDAGCMSKSSSTRGVSSRGELRTGIAVALMVENRRFLEATGSFEGLLLVAAGLVTVSREDDVTWGTGLSKLPALLLGGLVGGSLDLIFYCLLMSFSGFERAQKTNRRKKGDGML